MLVCVKKFDLNQEEVLTSLKKAINNKILKIANKKNKNSYRVVQETHFDKECVLDSQICEILESTDVDKGISITVKPVLTTTFLKRPPVFKDHVVVLP